MEIEGFSAWKPGDRLTINIIQYGDNERSAVLDVMDVRKRFAAGHYVDALQKSLAAFTDGGDYLLTNSGSSALDVAVKTLLAHGTVKKGDLVLHPTCTFNTSATCIINNGLIPVFVDIVPATYNIDPWLALKAMEELDIKLIVLPHLIGNMTNLDVVLRAAKEKFIPTIGDSCDTLGSMWRDKEVGAYTDFTAYSFYASHHISSGGVGGALRVNNVGLRDYDFAKSLIHWGHDYASRTGDLDKDFFVRYNCLTLGGDSQMTEMQAAFGLAQMDKLSQWNERREIVFKTLLSEMAEYSEYFLLPQSYYGAKPSWFALPLTVLPTAPFSRDAFARALINRNIEIRPLFAGNITKQHAWRETQRMIYGATVNADMAASHGLFVPSWPMANNALEYLVSSIHNAMKELTK